MATHNVRVNVVNVVDILQKCQEGSTKDYDVLVSKLSDENIDSPSLVACLLGLKDCLYMLDKEYDTLIGTILRIDWTSHEPYAVQEYRAFFINLLSAHVFYLKMCLRSFVRSFLPKIDIQSADGPPVVIDTETKQRHNVKFLAIHSLIKSISKIIPMTPKVLLPLLSQMFPYMTKDVYLQQCYVWNLLQITQYLPSHRMQILELIVDQMLKLDVRSPPHEIALNLDKNEDIAEEEGIFDMDDSACIIMGIVPTEKSARPSSLDDGGPMSHKEADRLDVLMNLMLCFIYRTCFPNGVVLDWEATRELYKELLAIFDKIILPTHASCHVQFIMFYICSFKTELCEGFIDYLWKNVQNPNTEPIFRKASVCYMGSLLARATFVPLSTLTTCLSLVCQWIHRYIENASHFTHADVSYHGPFYSVCQTVFYTFAFRHKDILTSKKGYKFAQNLSLQTIVTSRLNPLRICLPAIAKAFSSITRMHQLAFCDTIIERNSRCLLPVVSSSMTCPSRLTHVNPLDSFFPFDPYLLTRSCKCILPIYREYDGMVEEDSDNESQEDDDFLQEIQQDKGHTLKSQPDFMEYGVSPGFKKKYEHISSEVKPTVKLEVQ